MRYGGSEHLPDTGHTHDKDAKQQGVLDGNYALFVVPKLL